MEKIVLFFVSNRKNANTEKATTNWLARYRTQAVENNFVQNLETLDATNSNNTLDSFFTTVTKKDGKNYEPSSLGNMQSAIDRYLKEKGVTFSILKDTECKGSKDVIEGRARYLRENLGLGRKPNRSRSLNTMDEEELWKSGQLGDVSVRCLNNTMWYLLTQHFGLRGRQEHYTMKMEVFVISKRRSKHGVFNFR